MNDSPVSILKKFWGYDSFRPMQEEIIQSVLDGKDTLALLPTSGGKSICFQVPAMMQDGLCLVITPLIALMKDQVANLESKGISAIALHSGMTFYEVKKVLQNAAYGSYKFLYLSPERIESALFKEYLPALDISLVAVDEAHCVSQWGYDFRPPYLRIADLRDELHDVPILAITASATPLVQDDIIEKLKFQSHNIFQGSFERLNISYSVFKVDSKINKLTEILKNVEGSSIVYCKSRRLAKEVTEFLSAQNISTDFYHAGLVQEERTQKQEAWIKNDLRVMVCTNAFGMGIDKPDVRTVIHYDIPDCLENYYQEAGRAGRDGKKSYAVLLYHTLDLESLEALPGKRFPAVYDIRKVYQSLADYLEIPVGIGEGNYYDFDLNEFTKNFQLDIFLVINTLKVLEQEGHLGFNENIFLPSQVNFSADKNQVNDFEESQPQLEPLIKCLLRTYEGIIDNRVSVHEKQIARLMRRSEVEIKNELGKLQSFGIIEYLPKKETPQIHFLLNRAPAEFLHIDHAKYTERKKEYELRVETILKYATLENQCRSRFIANYFGDETDKDCGICDNCLEKRNTNVSGNDFINIQQTIFQKIPQEGIAVKELLQQLKNIHQTKFWEVLEYLQSERKIVVDENGFVKKKI